MMGNEQLISIFDGGNQKSYLLERAVMGHIRKKNVSNLQDVATARFKCLPVTDYGTIMMNMQK